MTETHEADKDLLIRKGEHLTCSAGHKCAVFLRDIRRCEVVNAEDLCSVQANYRVRAHRAFPPCFECGRVVDANCGGITSLHVEDRWAPPLSEEQRGWLHEIEDQVGDEAPQGIALFVCTQLIKRVLEFSLRALGDTRTRCCSPGEALAGIRVAKIIVLHPLDGREEQWLHENAMMRLVPGGVVVRYGEPWRAFG